MVNLNRRLLREQFTRSIKESIKHQDGLALMFLDLDRFKQINDTFGHDAGDELLKQFAKRVKDCIREEDVLVRMGGDEFVILLPNIGCEAQLITIAERILNALQEPWEILEHEFVTTSSIGIALYEDGDQEKKLLKKADMALYQAKSEGRNTFKFYQKEDLEFSMQ